MNETHEHRELETLIARQALRQPSVKLDDRMKHLFVSESQADLASANERGVIASPWFRSVLRIAALLALVALIGLAILAQIDGDAKQHGSLVKNPDDGRHLVQPVSSVFNPVRIEQSWTRVQPQDVVVIDGDPLRRYQRETVEHVQLIDEKNNIRIEYTLPRRETIVMPVKYD